MSSDRLERAGFPFFLAARCEGAEAGHGVTVRIPFRDEIANPGGALHGGVMASAIVIAATMAARSDSAQDLGGGRSLDLSVDYLSAAISEDIVADAKVLRRGKEITYVKVDVHSDSGKPIAVGLVTHRSQPAAGGTVAQLHSRAATPPAPAEPIRGANLFVSHGFIAALGMQVEQARDGHAILTMAADPRVSDDSGGIHEGALAALLDTSGALASWSLTGLDLRFKASTVGIHVNFFAAATGQVRAHAEVRRRDDEIFLNRVELSDAGSGAVVADATVTYRIVVPAVPNAGHS